MCALLFTVVSAQFFVLALGGIATAQMPLAQIDAEHFFHFFIKLRIDALETLRNVLM